MVPNDILVIQVLLPTYLCIPAAAVASQIAPVYIQWLVKSSLERKLHPPSIWAHKEKRVG